MLRLQSRALLIASHRSVPCVAPKVVRRIRGTTEYAKSGVDGLSRHVHQDH
jgi:hypothetical protein